MIKEISRSEQKLLPVETFKIADETVRQMALIEFYNGFNKPVKGGSLRVRLRKVGRWLDKRSVQILFHKDALTYTIASAQKKKQLFVEVELRMGGTQLAYTYVWYNVEPDIVLGGNVVAQINPELDKGSI